MYRQPRISEHSILTALYTLSGIAELREPPLPSPKPRRLTSLLPSQPVWITSSPMMEEEEEEEEYVSKPTQCSAKHTLRSDRTAAEATSTFRTPVDDGHVPNYTTQTMWTPHRQPTFVRCRA